MYSPQLMLPRRARACTHRAIALQLGTHEVTAVQESNRRRKVKVRDGSIEAISATARTCGTGTFGPVRKGHRVGAMQSRGEAGVASPPGPCRTSCPVRVLGRTPSSRGSSMDSCGSHFCLWPMAGCIAGHCVQWSCPVFDGSPGRGVDGAGAASASAIRMALDRRGNASK